MSKTVAITGASGFIGSALVRAFAANGWKVLALSRNKPAAMPEGCSWLGYDLTGSNLHLQGVDVLIHAAYIRSEANPNAESLNIEGAERLFDAATAAGVQQRIFISSLSADADSATVYGRQKWRIEQLLSLDSDLILRPGLVLGNGGLVSEMLTFLRSKKVAPLIGNGQQPIQYIGLDNLVSVLLSAANNRTSGTISVAHPESLPYKQFYKSLFDHLDIHPRFVKLPYPILLGMVRFFNTLGIQLSVSSDSLKGVSELKERPISNWEDVFGVEAQELRSILAGL